MSAGVKEVVDVIIPAYNEEASVGKVVEAIPRDQVRTIVVVDNNSTDRTGEVAREKGAVVLREERQGYGSACLKGMAYLEEQEPAPGIVVFLDADFSDHPEEMPSLLKPLMNGTADMVIGSRALGDREQGAMMPQQIFGNWLATGLMKWLHGVTYTDLGPFRAIRYDQLMALGMRDPDYGWTVEMQLKAARNGLRFEEVPVSYRKRIGRSKVAGTVKGTIMAGYKIIGTILKYRRR